MIKGELTTAAADNSKLRDEISDLKAKLKAAEDAAPAVSEEQSSKIAELEKLLAEEKKRYSELEKEQEDLLVCMGKVKRVLTNSDYTDK